SKAAILLCTFLALLKKYIISESCSLITPDFVEGAIAAKTQGFNCSVELVGIPDSSKLFKSPLYNLLFTWLFKVCPLEKVPYCRTNFWDCRRILSGLMGSSKKSDL